MTNKRIHILKRKKTVRIKGSDVVYRERGKGIY